MRRSAQRSSARFGVLLAGVGALLAGACQEEAPVAPPPSLHERAMAVGAQLVDAVNRGDRSALSPLVAWDSPEGPQRPTADQLKTLSLPPVPWTLNGAGRPGHLEIQDAKGQKHSLRVVRVSGRLRVLARRAPLAAAHGSGSSAPTGLGMPELQSLRVPMITEAIAPADERAPAKAPAPERPETR